MNTKILIVMLISALPIPAALGQGSLIPPGPPAPTMKTLTQIEPRAAITGGTAVTISAPGSYYLTTNITVASGDAVVISTNNVTLDLNGFTISSSNPLATGYGILLSGPRMNITILNGHITGNVTQSGGVYRGSGFDTGIGYSSGSAPHNVRVEGVTVSGCQSSGIYLDVSGSVVESCTVDTVGYVGIYAQTVSDSSALNCGSLGVDGLTIQNSLGSAIGADGTGLYAAYSANNSCGTGTSSGSSVDNSYGLYAGNAINCYGVSGNGCGLYAANTANNCSGSSINGVGLVAAAAAANCSGASTNNYGLQSFFEAQNCFGTSQSSEGIVSIIAAGCYGQTASGGEGIYCSVANNCVGNYTGGTAIFCSIAIGCIPYAGTISASQKFLGTP